MIDGDKTVFVKQITRLAVAMGVTLEPARIAIYFERLRGFAIEAVTAAMQDAVDTTTEAGRLPSVGRLRQLCETASRALREDAAHAEREARRSLTSGVTDMNAEVRALLDELYAKLATEPWRQNARPGHNPERIAL